MASYFIVGYLSRISSSSWLSASIRPVRWPVNQRSDRMNRCQMVSSFSRSLACNRTDTHQSIERSDNVALRRFYLLVISTHNTRMSVHYKPNYTQYNITVQTVGDTRFMAAITVCYETDTPDLARRKRWTPFSVDGRTHIRVFKWLCS